MSQTVRPAAGRPGHDNERSFRDERGGEDHDVRQIIASLAALKASTRNLRRQLAATATIAVKVIPGINESSITLLRGSILDIVVATSGVVRDIEYLQHRLHEGPSVSALAKGRTVCSGSLAIDQRWPRFGPSAASSGVESSMSFPLNTPTGIAGVINMYACTPHAFDQRAEELGELIGGLATSVQTALVRSNAELQTLRLQASLGPRGLRLH